MSQVTLISSVTFRLVLQGYRSQEALGSLATLTNRDGSFPNPSLVSPITSLSGDIRRHSERTRKVLDFICD